MRSSARSAESSRLDVWPAFGDTMLSFLLVVMLMLVFQVATNIRIVSEVALSRQVQIDQQRIQAVVAALRRRNAAISIAEPDGNSQEITLGSEALFESGSDRLSRPGTLLLAELVQQIVGADVRTLKEITVKGHTDDVSIANSRFASNWELSTARATRVVRALTAEDGGKTGIDPRRVTLVAAGYGQYRPAHPGNRTRNRRIEIRLIFTNQHSQ